MKLLYFADIIQAKISIHSRLSPCALNARWYADFDSCDIKESSILRGAFGNGNTPEEALKDYVDQIKGKLIVFNARASNISEFKVPEDLEL